MADTFTTRNRFQKQEVGAHVNTWGSELNAKGGSDLIDSALDGVESYTLSGSKTLTSTNASDSEAIQRIQNITGGTGGTVTIPSVEKNYIVRNAASGDVIFTTGGGTTATIKSGNTATIFCDGTNVHLALLSDFGSTQLKSTATASAPNHLVNKALLDVAAFSAALPGQYGNAGKYVTTNGTAASWAAISSADVTGALTYTPTSVTTLTGVQSISDFKTGLSLNNVTNTSDASKPVSSAQQTALDLKLNLDGGTLTGPLITVASGTGAAGLNIAPGTAPTSPNNGDFWTTSGGVFARVGGVTQQLALAGGWTQIDTKAATSGTNVDFNSIPATYSDLLVEALAVSGTSGGAAAINLYISINNGSSFSAQGVALGNMADASAIVYGAAVIFGYRLGGVICHSGGVTVDGDMATTSGSVRSFRASTPINALRIAIGAGAFDAGTIKLYAR